jgi:hypothetical protein
MKIKEYKQMMAYLTKPQTPENLTLVKNMKHVKWKEIPPLKGPNSQGLIKEKKQDKPIQDKKYGRYR